MDKQIMENIYEKFGEEALRDIERSGYDGNMFLVYAEGGEFEILGGLFSNHSMTVDEALEVMGIDMDDLVEGLGWDGWDPDALHLVPVA